MARQFPKALEDWMDARKVNASELAYRVHVDPGMVSRWLTGERKPSAQHLLAIARTLDVDPYELYDGSFKEPRAPREGVKPGRRPKAALPLAEVSGIVKGPRKIAPAERPVLPGLKSPPKRPRPQVE